MIILRAERFDRDVERQFRWYLVETSLDPVAGNELAERFADAVEQALSFLAQHPQAGRPRFTKTKGFSGMRSWGLKKPFGRFLVFYRFTDDLISAERLLEGHRRPAGGG